MGSLLFWKIKPSPIRCFPMDQNLTFLTRSPSLLAEMQGHDVHWLLFCSNYFFERATFSFVLHLCSLLKFCKNILHTRPKKICLIFSKSSLGVSLLVLKCSFMHAIFVDSAKEMETNYMFFVTGCLSAMCVMCSHNTRSSLEFSVLLHVLPRFCCRLLSPPTIKESSSRSTAKSSEIWLDLQTVQSLTPKAKKAWNTNGTSP